MGLSAPEIIVRHILPNISSLLIIDATLGVGGAILAETGLSFFGFGVQPPDVSLGTLIGEGSRRSSRFPWLFFVPAACSCCWCSASTRSATGCATPSTPTPQSGGSPMNQTGGSSHRAATRRRQGPADHVRAPCCRSRTCRSPSPPRPGRSTPSAGLSFDLAAGETLAIVGESGSGKSVTSLAVMGLHPPSARITGSVKLHGEELLGRSDEAMSKIRGNELAMVFQDPLSALTPVYTIGDQIVEAIQIHHDVTQGRGQARAVELLDLVGIPNPDAGSGRSRTSSPAACASGP